MISERRSYLSPSEKNFRNGVPARSVIKIPLCGVFSRAFFYDFACKMALVFVYCSCTSIVAKLMTLLITFRVELYFNLFC
jgi:hypothetical protein